MENFKEIAEKCLAGEFSGTFVLRNGDKCISSNFKKDQSLLTSFRYLEHFHYSDCGHCYMSTGRKFKFDIIDFIPDNMQEQIKIDIPEGKVPVMEQTESGVVITWKEKELTYSEIYESLWKSGKLIHHITNTDENAVNDSFIIKVNVLRKLTNIRNYFGKPDENEKGWIIEQGGIRRTAIESHYYSYHIIFAEREHAEQAIKMLGDELKYLFEPW